MKASFWGVLGFRVLRSLKSTPKKVEESLRIQAGAPVPAHAIKAGASMPALALDLRLHSPVTGFSDVKVHWTLR